MYIHFYISGLALFLRASRALQPTDVPPLGTPTCLQPFFAEETISPLDVNIAGYSMLKTLGCKPRVQDQLIQLPASQGAVVAVNGLTVVVDHNNTVPAIRTCDQVYGMLQKIVGSCAGQKTSGGFVEDGEVGAVVAVNDPQITQTLKRSRARRRRDESDLTFDSPQGIDPNKFTTMTRPARAVLTSPPNLDEAKLLSNEKRQNQGSTTTASVFTGFGTVTVTFRSFQTTNPMYIAASDTFVSAALRSVSDSVGAGAMAEERSSYFNAPIIDPAQAGRVTWAVNFFNELPSQAAFPVQALPRDLMALMNNLFLADWRQANTPNGIGNPVNIMQFTATRDGSFVIGGTVSAFALPSLVTPGAGHQRNNMLITNDTPPRFAGWLASGPFFGGGSIV